MSTQAGWRPDPESPGISRWWDGEGWTEQRTPTQSVSPGGVSTLKIVIGVCLGIVLAIAAVAIFSAVIHSNDGLDCNTKSLQRMADGKPALDCSQYDNN